MNKNFMPELDKVKNLDKVIDNKDNLKKFDFTAPHDDYSKWKDLKTVVKLMNVKFDARNNVVNWKDEDTRDKYFDDVKDDCYTFETKWNLLSLENFAPSLGAYQGNIIVDLPLEQALGYNYVYIDRYQQPTKNDDNTPVRSRFFFFITGIKAKPVAPNASNLIIELDAWTEYSCEGFKTLSGDLERGHYAMDKVSTSDYLSNPLDCKVNLFANEPTLPSIKNKVNYENMITPYSDPIIVLATTSDLTKEPYSDGKVHDVTSEWWNDYESYFKNITATGKATEDYLREFTSSISKEPNFDLDNSVPTTNAEQPDISGQNLTGLFYYGIEIDTFNELINILRTKYPQVFKTFKGVFIIPRKYCNIGEQFTSTLGVDMFHVEQNNAQINEKTLKLTPEMFGYKEDDYTKLYTSQFSEIEISNMNGEISKISIEDTTGSLEFMFRANVMFPFLKFEGFVNGIGGSIVNTYKLAPLKEEDYNGYVSNWEAIRTNWSIPTYGIYQDAKSYSYSEMEMLKREAVNSGIDYQKTIKDLVKVKANSLNDIDTTFITGDNSAKNTQNISTRNNQNNFDTTNATINKNYGNSNNSNKTTLDNAIESATTTNTNSNRSNDNTLANDLLNAKTNKGNNERSNDNTLANALSVNANTQDINNYSNTAVLDNGNNSNENTRTVTGNENDNTYINSLDTEKVNSEALSRTLENTRTNQVNTAKINRTNNLASADNNYKNTNSSIDNTKSNADRSVNNSYDIAINNANNTKSNSVVSSQKVSNDETNSLQINKGKSDLAIGATALGSAASILVSSTEKNLTFTPSGGGGDAISAVNKAGIAGLAAGTTATNTAINAVNIKQSASNQRNYISDTASNNVSTEKSNAQSSKTTALTNNSNNSSTNKAIATNNNTVSKGNIENSYQNSVNVANASYDTGEENNSKTYDQQKVNTTRTHDMKAKNLQLNYTVFGANLKNTYDTNASNYWKTRQTDDKVANNNHTTTKNNISDTYDKDVTVANNNFTTNQSNISDTFTKDKDVANNTFNTNKANIQNDYDTNINNNKNNFDTTNKNISDNFDNTENNLNIDKNNAITNLNNDLDNSATNAELDYLRSKIDINNKHLSLLSRPVISITENTGDGSIDAWGNRGFDVKINRVSKANEETITNEFSRYGYMMPINTWITAPTFEPIQSKNHPRNFSYWKFRNIMSWSTKMSETSKRVIIEILENGVSIYDKPENVNNGVI